MSLTLLCVSCIVSYSYATIEVLYENAMLTNTVMITKKRHPHNFAQEKYSVYRKISKETINNGKCSVLKVHCMSYLS